MTPRPFRGRTGTWTRKSHQNKGALSQASLMSLLTLLTSRAVGGRVREEEEVREAATPGGRAAAEANETIEESGRARA